MVRSSKPPISAISAQSNLILFLINVIDTSFESEDEYKPLRKGAEVQDMLNSATTRWSDLNDALNRRRHDLQNELMSLGDLDSALDALLKWIQTVQESVNTIPISRGDKKSLDFEMARLKMIQANAARRQPDVVKINQEAIALNRDKFSPKLTQLNLAWEKLKQSLGEKQIKLEEALREVSYSF